MASRLGRLCRLQRRADRYTVAASSSLGGRGGRVAGWRPDPRTPQDQPRQPAAAGIRSGPLSEDGVGAGSLLYSLAMPPLRMAVAASAGAPPRPVPADRVERDTARGRRVPGAMRTLGGAWG